MNKPDWLFLSEEELNNSFNVLKTDLNSKKFLNINTPEDLFNLRGFILNQFKVGYFKSERHMIAFFLSNYESNIFNEALGITRRHFVDKKLAKKWMIEMQNEYHPDKNINIKSDIDFAKISDGINKAYAEMVGQK